MNTHNNQMTNLNKCGKYLKPKSNLSRAKRAGGNPLKKINKWKVLPLGL